MVFLGSWVAVFAHCLLLAAGGTASAGSYCSEQHDATSDDFSTLVVALQPRQQKSQTGQLAEAGVSATMDAQSAAADLWPEVSTTMLDETTMMPETSTLPPHQKTHRKGKGKGKGRYPTLRCSQCRKKHGKAHCRRVCGAFPSKFQGQKFKGTVKEKRPGQSYHYGSPQEKRPGQSYHHGSPQEKRPGQSYHHGSPQQRRRVQSYYSGSPQVYEKRPQQAYDASCPQPPCEEQPDNQQIVTVNADFKPGADPAYSQPPAYHPVPIPYQK